MIAPIRTSLRLSMKEVKSHHHMHKVFSCRFSTSKEIKPPTTKQLQIVALRYAIPMIGFGFMDNLVMIQAGDAIDNTFGVALGISTMTAAGFGQCFSDVAGNISGGTVDAAVARLNLPHHHLTEAQLDMRQTRIWRTLGACVGVVTGCLLGMSFIIHA